MTEKKSFPIGGGNEVTYWQDEDGIWNVENSLTGHYMSPEEFTPETFYDEKKFNKWLSNAEAYWTKKYIADILYEEIYDPWTEDCTTESIMKDIKKKPLELMYALCSRLKECLDDMNKLEEKLKEKESVPENNYAVTFSYETWCFAKTEDEAIKNAMKKFDGDVKAGNVSADMLDIKVQKLKQDEYGNWDY